MLPNRDIAGCQNSFAFTIFFHLIAEGGFQIDHFAQQNLFAQQFIAPNCDRLKRQRAFAKPKDHRVAPCLDPFGNRNFTFAAEQLNRTHFTKIHAHGIVGAIKLFGFTRG